MDSGQIAAIILAAGSSSRMGGVKKEFAKLPNGETVLACSVRVFSSLAENIIIVVPQNCEAQAKDALPAELKENQNNKINFVKGADTRRGSTLNALRALLPFNPRYVLIHDGARPFISNEAAANLIDAVKKYGAVIPVLEITETPKELGIKNEELRIKNVECGIKNVGIRGENKEQTAKKEVVFIERHLKRVNIVTAQTPQCFKFPEILYAHEEAAKVDEEFTDDAEIWGRFVGQVAAIPGDINNRKITFPQDLN